MRASCYAAPALKWLLAIIFLFAAAAAAAEGVPNCGKQANNATCQLVGECCSVNGCVSKGVFDQR
jgi:hypothetical protein